MSESFRREEVSRPKRSRMRDCRQRIRIIPRFSKSEGERRRSERVPWLSAGACIRAQVQRASDGG